MAELEVSIYGKKYTISCDDGEEQRVVELGQYIDSKVRDIAYAGAASSSPHLLVLASLMITDELFEMRKNAAITNSDEAAQSVENMAQRIEYLANKLEKAV